MGSAHGVESIGRFIEDEQIRVVQHGLCEPQALSHPFGVATHCFVFASFETHEFEEFFFAGGDLRVGHFAKAAVEVQSASTSVVSRKDEVFGEVSNFASSSFAACRQLEDLGRTSRRMQYPEKDFDQSCFPSTVGAEKSEDFPSMDLKRDFFERGVDAWE